MSIGQRGMLLFALLLVVKARFATTASLSSSAASSSSSSLASSAAVATEKEARAMRHQRRHRMRKLAVADEDPSEPSIYDSLTTAAPTFSPDASTLASLLAAQSPTMDAWKDMQPANTAVGRFLVAGMQERPTVTPPPLQSSLDVVRAGCPMVISWPTEVLVYAINPCETQATAMWSNAVTHEPIVQYSQSCSPFNSGMSALTSYVMAEGEHSLAQSQVLTTVTGTKVALRDCRGTQRFVIEEKVFHERDGQDAHSCKKYGSCDGIVWIQYFIYEDDHMVAMTPYLHLFQSTVSILDPASGMKIAEAKRLGEWDPNILDCQGSRRWHLKFEDFEDQPNGTFKIATNQWPIASMLSVMALRDQHRGPSGLVAPSWCDISKGVTRFFLLASLAAGLLVGFLLFLRDGVPPVRAALWEFELRFCQRRMLVPSKYGGMH